MSRASFSSLFFFIFPSQIFFPVKHFFRTYLVVQWLRLHTPNAGGLGSIPGQGTRSHMPQLSPDTAIHIKNKYLKNFNCILESFPNTPLLSPNHVVFYFIEFAVDTGRNHVLTISTCSTSHFLKCHLLWLSLGIYFSIMFGYCWHTEKLLGSMYSFLRLLEQSTVA